MRSVVLPLACCILMLIAAEAAPSKADVGSTPGAAGLVGAPERSAPAKLDLDRAVRESLQREVRVSVASAELARAQALVRSARAAMLPSLIGHASYLRLDRERISNGQLVAGRDQLLADVTLTVPLVAPKPWVETSHASDNVDVARLELSDVRRRVALATAQAFLTVIAQHRSIEVQQNALVNAQAHYHYAHTRFEGGIGNQIDDVRAGQEVETSTAQLERSLAALNEAQEALGVLVGRDAPVDAMESVALPNPPSLAQALADANARRGDVRADAARAHVSQQVVDDDWVEYAPLLVAQAQPFYHEPGTVAAPHTGWQLQILLTIPFYDGGLRGGVFAARAATLAQDRAQLEATRRQAKSEVRVALQALRHADVTLGSTVRASELAGQALRMANLAYEAGAVTNIEVIDAERRSRDAATAVVVAEDDARQARLELLAASGRFPAQ
jgi:outer membrane protein TolC